MIHKLKNYLKGRGKRFALLAVWLALSGAVVLSLPSGPAQPENTPLASTQSASTNNESEPAAAEQRQVAAETTKNSQSPSSQPETPSKPAKNSIAPKPAAKVTVSLNIEDNFAGKVTLPAGGNHCDVLTQALKDGIISSLEMRYSEAHKSYGVYVINGVGNSSNIWWAYKVNGRSPPLGCSHIKVNSGDSIKWEYVN